MSEFNGPSSSETAYRAVLEMQAHKARAESAWSGPDVSSKESTSPIVWGAFFGLLAGAFGGGSSGFIASIVTMLVGMAIGAGLVWGIGKAFRLFFGILGLIFRTAKKIVGG